MMNKYNPNIHHRSSIRLKGYDYSQAGMYFITICVQNRECLFGKITDGEMVLNELGEIAHNEWLRTAELRQNVQLGEFVIMPNHIHGIICIVETPPQCPQCATVGTLRAVVGTLRAVVGTLRAVVGTLRAVVGTLRATSLPQPPPPPQNEYMSFISPKRGTLSSIIRSYKSAVSKNIHLLGENFAWQSRFHDHIIRNNNEYWRIAHYIANNPLKWADDTFCLD